jgi:hypothetical protein
MFKVTALFALVALFATPAVAKVNKKPCGFGYKLCESTCILAIRKTLFQRGSVIGWIKLKV